MSVTDTNTAEQIDDGLTDAERNYFQTGGDVNDALVKESTIPEVPSEVTQPQPDPLPEVASPPLQPEGASDDDDDATAPSTDPSQPARKQQQRVSLSKFQAAEEARQRAEAQLQAEAVRNARIEERLSLLQQALQEPAAEQPAEPQRPDPEQDIFGYARYLEDQLKQVIGKVNNYEEQITTGQAEMEAERRYFDSLNTFGATKPDFVPAYNFLLRSRAAELIERDPRFAGVTDEQLQGVANGTIRIPVQISDALRAEERDLYRTAFESNRDPAATIYRYATVRGYRPPAPQTQQPATNGAASPQQVAATPGAPGTPLGGTGPRGTPVPQAAAPRQPTATEVVQSIQNGQRAALSLSQAGGSAGGGELTPAMLADMSQEQFEAIFNELQATGNFSKLRDLMGH